MLTTLHTFPLRKGLHLLQTRLQILSSGSTPVPASSKCKPCTESQGLSLGPSERDKPRCPQGPDVQPFTQDLPTEGVRCELAGQQTPAPRTHREREEKEDLACVL